MENKKIFVLLWFLLLNTSCSCDLFIPEHLKDKCLRAAVFDKKIFIDLDKTINLKDNSVCEEEEEPRIICVEGEAFITRFNSNRRMCVVDFTTVKCFLGCRKDCHGPLKRRFTIFDAMEKPSSVCEENRAKRVGDVCVRDEDCIPILVTYDEKTKAYQSTYLRCDKVSKRCVQQTGPPSPEDFGKSCNLSYSKTYVEENNYSFVRGAIGTQNCAEGVCFFPRYSSEKSCLYQLCTRLCRGHDDCSQGTFCYRYDGMERINPNEERKQQGVCITKQQLLDYHESTTCVPFLD